MSSRFSRSRRARTSTVSSTSCLTAVLSVARLDAMKSASRPGSVMFIASACRSSDSSGDSETTCWKLVLMFRCSASISSRSSSRTVSSAAFDAGAQVRAHGRNGLELQARESLHDEAQAAVGQLEHLVDVRRRADPVHVVLGRLFDRGVPLGEHADELAPVDRLFDEADGALARDCQRQERIGKQHRVAQRQNRQLARNRYRLFCGRVADVETFVFTTHDYPRGPAV